MLMEKAPSATIDEYIDIGGFPAATQAILTSVREAIKDSAPDAEETIRHQMPTFRMKNADLVYFAGDEHHIVFYPTPSAVAAFEMELSGYEGLEGSVRFPIDEPMPLGLIRSIVKFRVKEVSE